MGFGSSCHDPTTIFLFATTEIINAVHTSFFFCCFTWHTVLRRANSTVDRTQKSVPSRCIEGDIFLTIVQPPQVFLLTLTRSTRYQPKYRLATIIKNPSNRTFSLQIASNEVNQVKNAHPADAVHPHPSTYGIPLLQHDSSSLTHPR